MTRRRLAELKTTLTELNTLYALYCEAVNHEPPDPANIGKLWFAYVMYVYRYKTERGLPVDALNRCVRKKSISGSKPPAATE